MSDLGDVTDTRRILEEIQRQLMEQARAVYSAQVVEHAYNPRNLGRIERPDTYAIMHGWCGDTMEIYLQLDKKRTNEEIITQAGFVTDGCGPSIASGSMLMTMVQGISLEEAGLIEPEDLLDALGGLPEETTHCAYLAVDTLRKSIATWYRSVRARDKETDGQASIDKR
jgi:nitrogen fixation NifU-like protein